MSIGEEIKLNLLIERIEHLEAQYRQTRQVLDKQDELNAEMRHLCERIIKLTESQNTMLQAMQESVDSLRAGGIIYRGN
jgi:uncharacterized protein YlxW (UPF0749 family)